MPIESLLKNVEQDTGAVVPDFPRAVDRFRTHFRAATKFLDEALDTPSPETIAVGARIVREFLDAANNVREEAQRLRSAIEELCDHHGFPPDIRDILVNGRGELSSSWTPDMIKEHEELMRRAQERMKETQS